MAAPVSQDGPPVRNATWSQSISNEKIVKESMRTPPAKSERDSTKVLAIPTYCDQLKSTC